MSDITRSEAIDVIESIMRKYEEDECVCCDIMIGDEEFESLRFARDSLKVDEAYNLMYEQPEFCEDCISRSETIEWIENLRTLNEHYHPKSKNNHLIDCDSAIDHLKQVPSVLPKAKKGHWIKEDRGWVEYSAVCSECGDSTFWSEKSNFCPNCGANMREVEE